MAANTSTTSGVYSRIIERIFLDRWTVGATEIPFERSDIVSVTKKLRVKLPKNLGDVIYSIRYRTPMPASVIECAPQGKSWVIEGVGRAKYCFKLARLARVVPNTALLSVKIPDATPQLVSRYAQGDEQALLAKLRYNRLVDIFLGVAAYSLQNHLRSTVLGVGQIEIDELYVGVDKGGRQFAIPVQAKSGTDELSSVQMRQDMEYCRERFSNLICRPIAAQFAGDDLIALFELALDDGEMRIVEEKHYRLVQACEISSAELRAYSER